MREDIKNRLTCATRQFRHNSDNSPDVFNPRDGFVIAYDREEVDELVGDLLGELEAARAQQSGEGRVAIPRDVAEAHGMYLIGYSWLKHNAPNEINLPADKPEGEGEWVQCWYRLPTMGVWVSGLSGTGKVIPAMLVDNGDSAFFRTANDEISEGAIVAWQPLPAATDTGGE